MKNLKKKIIDVTSDILSAYPRYKANKSIKKSNQMVEDIKLNRETKHYDLSDKDWKDPIFRARANVNGYKYDQEQKIKKLLKNKSNIKITK
jgi:hypothetical protein